jgi:hypothetical protein
MKRLIVVAALFSVSLVPQAALACLPVGGWAPNSPADDAAFAVAMVRQAAHVEVVEVQSSSPFADPELWRRWIEDQKSRYRGPPPQSVMQRLEQVYEERRLRPVGTRYDLRVVQRLKGEGSDIVRLDGAAPFGAAANTPVGPPLQHWIEKGVKWPFVFKEPDELSPANLLEPSVSCDAGPIRFAPGARYLIFRGDDGHLLGPVRFKGIANPRLGYRVVVVSPGGPANWLAAVEKAAKAAKR